jgi:hypothetical protein
MINITLVKTKDFNCLEKRGNFLTHVNTVTNSAFSVTLH